ncbi:hypothetical protein ANO11243_062430 [Dothideomycetidae sp. 11243]|nr:hypothetical protein ANO11243_062430 [fungal sp. No.11243]
MSTTAFFNSSQLEGPDRANYTQPVSLLVQESNVFTSISVIFLVLCWVAVGLRVYVRAYLIKTFGADDWAISITLFFFTFYAVLCCVISSYFEQYAVPLAAGQTPYSSTTAIVSQSAHAHRRSVLTIAQIVTIAYCLYSATMIGFKFTMGFFFLKIFVFRTPYIVMIWISIIIPTILGVINIVYTAILSCEIETLFFIGTESCLDYRHSQGWLAVAETWTIANTVSDLFYTVLSVIAMVNLHMKPKDKLTAGALCALGSVASLASLVRLFLLIFSLPVYSLLGESVMEAIWTVIEPGLGITAASLATLRPLLRKISGEHTAGDPTPDGSQERTNRSKVLQLVAVKNKEEVVVQATEVHLTEGRSGSTWTNDPAMQVV